MTLALGVTLVVSLQTLKEPNVKINEIQSPKKFHCLLQKEHFKKHPSVRGPSLADGSESLPPEGTI